VINIGRRFMWKAVGALACAAALLPAWAQQSKAPPATIYVCTTADGRKLTSDRPIVECLSREQRVLNSDGSVRAVHPPSLTAEERADKEARERQAQAEKLAQQEAIRRDRNLMARYRDEAAHRRAREAALDTVRIAMKASEVRLQELANERKPLVAESEFYSGKRMPAKLRQALDANDTALEAQRSVAQTQEAELARINALYDAELERLRRLWAGAAPGTLGALNPAPAASSVSRASASRAP
jgi:hypothetical protein